MNIKINIIPSVVAANGKGRILGPKIATFEQYEQFCLKMAKENCLEPEFLAGIKRPLMMFKEKIESKEQLHEFCQNTFALGQKVLAMGNEGLANILLSTFLKHADSSSKDFYKAAVLAKNYSEAVSDLVHTYARLVSLGEYYKANNMRSELYSNTLLQIKCLKNIIRDYKGAKQNHQTIKREVPPYYFYVSELARVYEKMASIHSHGHRNKAVLYLKKARELYKQINYSQSLRKIDVRFKWIKLAKRKKSPHFPQYLTNTEEIPPKKRHYKSKAHRRPQDDFT